MNLTSRMAILTLTVSMLVLLGCGGAGLDYGQQRNLQAVEPNFVNPSWFDQYEEDPAKTLEKYKDKVLQLDLRIEQFEELSKGIQVVGFTGDNNAYRAYCMFPQAASGRIQSYGAGDAITVKGLFNGIEPSSNTLQIRMSSCVLTRE